jgi:DNA-binding NtrC family response regulator
VLLPGSGGFFGRDPESLRLVRQLPGRNFERPALDTPYLSRRQLEISADGGGISVKHLGRRPLLISGTPVDEARVMPGDQLLIEGVIGFFVALRPGHLPAHTSDRFSRHRFGQADTVGLVGESPAMWELRERIAFAGPRGAHVLILGESGTGKELAAQAIHALSPRAGRKLVARNAATIPDSLIDAELFGNLANYPNAGMPERRGLVGEADGSTLFLDEIGELPVSAQAHLLRVLDEGGEYHRLGESKLRRADFRLIGATNRPPEQLKQDLLARLALRLEIPSLNRRKEDVPLLATHLLQRLARRDPELGQRFFASWDGRNGVPRITAELALALVEHEYSTHVRELEAALWESLSESRGNALTSPPESAAPARPTAAPPPADPREIDKETLIRVLNENGWVRDRAWRALGLSSRFALRRLMKKYEIDAAGGEHDD